jgi:hypothetical protein
VSERERTRPSKSTRQAEAEDALVTPHPDDPPTRDEEEAAERASEVDEETERSYKDALERGARQKGEGRIQ